MDIETLQVEVIALRALLAANDPTTEKAGMEALSHAVALEQHLLVIEVYILLSRCYQQLHGDYVRALEYARQAETLALEYKTRRQLHAEILFLLADAYRDLQQYSSAIGYYNDCIEYIESIEAPDRDLLVLFSDVLNSTGRFYFRLTLKTLGKDYTERALALAQQLDDRDGIINCKMSIANYYFYIWNYEQAIKGYQEVLLEEARLPTDERRAVLHSYIGICYMEVGKMQEAVTHLLHSLAIRRAGMQRFRVAYPLYTLSILYLKMGKIAEADTLIEELFSLIKEYPNIFNEHVTNDLMWEIHGAKGDYKTAYEYWKKIKIGNVDTEVLEGTIQYMIQAEHSKQNKVKQEATMLKSLNEEMQQYSRQLEHTNTDLQSYARTASHDLREPLRMISTYMTILETKLSDKLSDDEKKFMHFAVDGAKRMDDMITRILQAAKTQDLSLHPVDLNRIATQAKENLTKLLQDRNAIVTHDPLPIVIGDDIPLLQVLQNLITNAVKYNQSEIPTVHVSFIKDAECCNISITDNGIGIAESERENVFKMYQRVANATGEDGTGIGLATVKRNIERMKGKIWIEANPTGGSVFKIELPMAV